MGVKPQALHLLRCYPHKGTIPSTRARHFPEGCPIHLPEITLDAFSQPAAFVPVRQFGMAPVQIE